MFKHNAYFLETLTNTHVGTGDSDNGIVDNMIQRDSRTGFPIMHSSSLKGAIKNHFKHYMAQSNHLPKDSPCIKPYTFQAIFGEEERENIFKKRLEKISDTAIQATESNDQSIIDTLINEIKSFNKDYNLGSEKNTDAKEKVYLYHHAPKQGLIKFFEARLLTLPLNATHNIYYHTTCPHAAIEYLNTLKQFHCSDMTHDIDALIGFFQCIQNQLNAFGKDFIVFSNNSSDPPYMMIDSYEKGLFVNQIAKEHDLDMPKIMTLIPFYFSVHNKPDYIHSFAVFHNNIFKEICQSRLPVIARNHLSEAKESKNLFYEEVLPAQSLLWFMTGAYQFSKDPQLTAYEKERHSFLKAFDMFEKKLLSDRIQIGANASIGYGVTSISKIFTERRSVQ